MSNSVGLVFGDLHLFDKPVGYHVDYPSCCLDCLNYIDSLITEYKADYVIFTGDLSGALSARRLQTHGFRLQVIKHFLSYNEKTNGKVYSIRGNHDFATKDLSEYDFLLGLDLIKHSDILVFGNKAIHLLDYGKRVSSLPIVSWGKDILINHEDLGSENAVAWYYAGDNRKIENCLEYTGIGTILAGHIHSPSPYVISSKIGEYPVDLVYLGCPTRPSLSLKDIWKGVYYAVITEHNSQEFDIELKIWDLPSLESTFFVYKKLEDIEEDAKPKLLVDAGAVKDIRNVLQNLSLYGIGDETIEKQIFSFAPGEYSDDVRNVALQYYLSADCG